jgi:hypothetical protein
MGVPEIEAFLNHLAVEGKISASTQNQALSSLETQLKLEGKALGPPAMTQQDLLQAASQLSVPDLQDFVAKVTAIYQERQSGQTADEAQLLSVVHCPPQTQQRWDELLQKRDDVSLWPAEYEELLQLTEVVEDWNVQRMAALSQLAQARQVDLRTMMRQLNEDDAHPELSAVIDRVEQRQGLVTFTPEAWNAEYRV